MQKFVLLFIMMHLWCVEDNGEVTHVPSSWHKSYENLDEFYEKSVVAPALTSHLHIFSNRVREKRDEIVLHNFGEKPHFYCHIPHLPFLNNGNIFDLKFFPHGPAKRCGVVTYHTEDSDHGYLMIKPPQDDVQFVRFPIAGARRPEVFCQYDVDDAGLVMTRFLAQYQDQSRYCVRVCMRYSGQERVAVSCGILGETKDGVSVYKEEKVLIFDFSRAPTRVEGIASVRYKPVAQSSVWLWF